MVEFSYCGCVFQPTIQRITTTLCMSHQQQHQHQQIHGPVGTQHVLGIAHNPDLGSKGKYLRPAQLNLTSSGVYHSNEMTKITSESRKRSLFGKFGLDGDDEADIGHDDIEQYQQQDAQAYVRMEEGQSYPTAEELQRYPLEMQNSLHNAALGVLKYRLIPVLGVYMRRHAKKMALNILFAHFSNVSTPSVRFLSKLSVFTGWNNLQSVADAFQPYLFVAHEYILFKGELENSGLHVLTVGTAVEEASAKHSRYSNPEMFVATGGSSCELLGECNLLTQHPVKRTIRAVTDCIVWVLASDAYQKALKEQPKEIQESVVNSAIRTRCQTMRLVYPLHEDFLTTFSIFQALPHDAVVTASRACIPKVFESSQTLFRQGEAANSVFILRRGSLVLTVMKAATSTTTSPPSRRTRTSTRWDSEASNSTQTPTKVSVVVKAPAVIGDLSWVQQTKRLSTCVATCRSDVYVLPKDSMKAVLATCDVTEILLLSGAATATTGGQPTPADPAKVAGMRDVSRRASSSLVGGSRRSSSSHAAPTTLPNLTRSPSVTSLRQSPEDAILASSLDSSTQYYRFGGYVRTIPLLAPILDGGGGGGNYGLVHHQTSHHHHSQPHHHEYFRPLITEIAEAIKPKVFLPSTTIASTAAECDQMILLLSGKGYVQRIRGLDASVKKKKKKKHSSGGGSGGKEENEDVVSHGEWLGFTLLVPHRWKYRVIAVDTVEAITLHQSDYTRILKRHKLLPCLVASTTALLYPMTVSQAEHEEAMNHLDSLKNVLNFPISDERTVPRTLSRLPTTEMLEKLPPVTMQNHLSTCQFSKWSMCRISTQTPPSFYHHGRKKKQRGLGDDDEEDEDETPASIKPVILGHHDRVVMGYRKKPKKL